MTSTPIQHNFWGQINEQLDKIAGYIDRPATTFDRVRDILLDTKYTRVVEYVNQNGTTHFIADEAFFAGTGGDRSLAAALTAAGWNHDPDYDNSEYSYVMVHPHTGERLRYIEGDIYRLAADGEDDDCESDGTETTTALSVAQLQSELLRIHNLLDEPAEHEAALELLDNISVSVRNHGLP